MSDKWVSMGDQGDIKKKKSDLKQFQVNELMTLAKPDPIYYMYYQQQEKKRLPPLLLMGNNL